MVAVTYRLFAEMRGYHVLVQDAGLAGTCSLVYNLKSGFARDVLKVATLLIFTYADFAAWGLLLV